MFSFANEGKVWWRVNLVVRDADGGEPTEAPVLLQYRIYTRSERKVRENKLKAPLAKLKAATDAEAISAAMRDMEALEEVSATDLLDRVLGWRDIADAKGEPLAFSKTTLKALLDDEAQYGRILAGLNEASKGARAKN